MDEEDILPAIVAVVVGLIVWTADLISENAITNACFSIIHESANSVSHYDPVAGALISLIPVVIVVCVTFVGIKALLKMIERLQMDF